MVGIARRLETRRLLGLPCDTSRFRRGAQSRDEQNRERPSAGEESEKKRCSHVAFPCSLLSLRGEATSRRTYRVDRRTPSRVPLLPENRRRRAALLALQPRWSTRAEDAPAILVLLLFVQLSSRRACQAVRQDYSFAKKRECPPALLVVVRSGSRQRPSRPVGAREREQPSGADGSGTTAQAPGGFAPIAST